MTGIVWAVLFAILPACAAEDSPNCAWDAGESGNGAGVSFVDVAGTAYYADGSKLGADGVLWQPLPPAARSEFAGHGSCLMRVGDTTRVVCADGFRAVS